MNATEVLDPIDDLNLSRREEKLLRALIGRRISRRRLGPEIPLEGAKGAGITAIMIFFGLLLGYLIFLASSEWAWPSYFSFLHPLSDYIDPSGLLIFLLFLIISIQIPVRERLIRKLFHALENKS